MKTFIISLGLLSLAFISPMKTSTEVPASFHEFEMTNIDGQPVSFAQFKGKKVLLVNVASRCGYTPQYESLQELHEKYGDKVVVLGFPANNFGGQEPGSNQEIASFCESEYGVTFPMFEKISVKGIDKDPLYRWLSDSSLNGWNDQEPSWNFCKYLVDENGKLVKFFPSNVNPMSDQMIKAIEG